MLEKIPFSNMERKGQELATTVLTCKGDLRDPTFPYRLRHLVCKLQSLISDKEKPFQVTKVEPWNSVRVTFNIPREAAQRLRQLAERGDHVLKDLGILSVQVEGEQVITLTLAGHYSEPQEVVFHKNSDPHSTQFSSSPSSAFDTSSLEGSPGPSNVEATRKNIVQYLSQQGGMATVAMESSHGTTLSEHSPVGGAASVDLIRLQGNTWFKSPNVVAPATSEPIPFFQTSSAGSTRVSPTNQTRTHNSFGPFPFASMTHAMTTKHAVHHHCQGGVTCSPTPSSSTSPPVHEQSYSHPDTMFSNLATHTSTVLPSSSSSASVNVALTSPLFVNLLQNDGQQEQQHPNLLMPPPSVDAKQPPKRKRKSHKLKGKPLNREDFVGEGENKPLELLSYSTSVSSFDHNIGFNAISVPPVSSTSTAFDNFDVLSRNPFGMSLPNIPSVPAFPSIHPEAEGQPQVHTGDLPYCTSAVSSSLYQTSQGISNGIWDSPKTAPEPVSLPSPSSSDGKTKHLINPFTGQLEPMLSDDEEEESTGSLALFPEFEMDMPENGQSERSLSDDGKDNNPYSDTDSGISKSLTDVSQSPESETNIQSTKVTVQTDSVISSSNPGEMLKLRLKLEPKVLCEVKENEKGRTDKDSGYSSQSPHKNDISCISIPSFKKTGLTNSSEPRVPPLHISLRGPNAAVVINPKNEEKTRSTTATKEVPLVNVADSLKVEGSSQKSCQFGNKSVTFSGDKKCSVGRSGPSVPSNTDFQIHTSNLKSEYEEYLDARFAETTLSHSQAVRSSIESSLPVSPITSSVLTVSSVKVPFPNLNPSVQIPNEVDKSRLLRAVERLQQPVTDNNIFLSVPLTATGLSGAQAVTSAAFLTVTQPDNHKKPFLIREENLICEEKSKEFFAKPSTNLPQPTEGNRLSYVTLLQERKKGHKLPFVEKFSCVNSVVPSSSGSVYSQATVSRVMTSSSECNVSSLMTSSHAVAVNQLRETLPDIQESQKASPGKGVKFKSNIKEKQERDPKTIQMLFHTNRSPYLNTLSEGSAERSEQEAHQITNGQQPSSSSSSPISHQDSQLYSPEAKNLGLLPVVTSSSVDHLNGPSNICPMDTHPLVKTSDNAYHNNLRPSYRCVNHVNSSISILNNQEVLGLSFVEVSRNHSSPVARVLTLGSNAGVSPVSKLIEVPSVERMPKASSIGCKSNFPAVTDLPTLVSSRDDMRLHQVSLLQNRDNVNSDHIRCPSSNQASLRPKSLVIGTRNNQPSLLLNDSTGEVNYCFDSQNSDNLSSFVEECDSTVLSEESSMDSVDEGTGRYTLTSQKDVKNDITLSKSPFQSYSSSKETLDREKHVSEKALPGEDGTSHYKDVSLRHVEDVSSKSFEDNSGHSTEKNSIDVLENSLKPGSAMVAPSFGNDKLPTTVCLYDHLTISNNNSITTQKVTSVSSTGKGANLNFISQEPLSTLKSSFPCVHPVEGVTTKPAGVLQPTIFTCSQSSSGCSSTTAKNKKPSFHFTDLRSFERQQTVSSHSNSVCLQPDIETGYKPLEINMNVSSYSYPVCTHSSSPTSDGMELLVFTCSCAHSATVTFTSSSPGTNLKLSTQPSTCFTTATSSSSTSVELLVSSQPCIRSTTVTSSCCTGSELTVSSHPYTTLATATSLSFTEAEQTVSTNPYNILSTVTSISSKGAELTISTNSFSSSATSTSASSTGTKLIFSTQPSTSSAIFTSTSSTKAGLTFSTHPSTSSAIFTSTSTTETKLTFSTHPSTSSAIFTSTSSTEAGLTFSTHPSTSSAIFTSTSSIEAGLTFSTHPSTSSAIFTSTNSIEAGLTFSTHPSTSLAIFTSTSSTGTKLTFSTHPLTSSAIFTSTSSTGTKLTFSTHPSTSSAIFTSTSSTGTKITFSTHPSTSVSTLTSTSSKGTELTFPTHPSTSLATFTSASSTEAGLTFPTHPSTSVSTVTSASSTEAGLTFPTHLSTSVSTVTSSSSIKTEPTFPTHPSTSVSAVTSSSSTKTELTFPTHPSTSSGTVTSSSSASAELTVSTNLCTHSSTFTNSEPYGMNLKVSSSSNAICCQSSIITGCNSTVIELTVSSQSDPVYSQSSTDIVTRPSVTQQSLSSHSYAHSEIVNSTKLLGKKLNFFSISNVCTQPSMVIDSNLDGMGLFGHPQTHLPYCLSDSQKTEQTPFTLAEFNVLNTSSSAEMKSTETQLTATSKCVVSYSLPCLIKPDDQIRLHCMASQPVTSNPESRQAAKTGQVEIQHATLNPELTYTEKLNQTTTTNQAATTGQVEIQHATLNPELTNTEKLIQTTTTSQAATTGQERIQNATSNPELSQVATTGQVKIQHLNYDTEKLNQTTTTSQAVTTGQMKVQNTAFYTECSQSATVGQVQDQHAISDTKHSQTVTTGRVHVQHTDSDTEHSQTVTTGRVHVQHTDSDTEHSQTVTTGQVHVQHTDSDTEHSQTVTTGQVHVQHTISDTEHSQAAITGQVHVQHIASDTDPSQAVTTGRVQTQHTDSDTDPSQAVTTGQVEIHYAVTNTKPNQVIEDVQAETQQKESLELENFCTEPSLSIKSDQVESHEVVPLEPCSVKEDSFTEIKPTSSQNLMLYTEPTLTFEAGQTKGQQTASVHTETFSPHFSAGQIKITPLTLQRPTASCIEPSSCIRTDEVNIQQTTSECGTYMKFNSDDTAGPFQIQQRDSSVNMASQVADKQTSCKSKLGVMSDDVETNQTDAPLTGKTSSQCSPGRESVEENDNSQPSIIRDVGDALTDVAISSHTVVCTSAFLSSTVMSSCTLSSTSLESSGSRFTLILKSTPSSVGQRSLLTSVNSITGVRVPFGPSKAFPIKIVTLPTGGSSLKSIKSSNRSVLEFINSSSASPVNPCFITSNSSSSPVRLVVSHLKPTLPGTSHLTSKVLLKSVVVTSASPAIRFVPIRGTLCSSSVMGSGSLLAVSSGSSLLQVSSGPTVSAKTNISMTKWNEQNSKEPIFTDHSKLLETAVCAESRSMGGGIMASVYKDHLDNAKEKTTDYPEAVADSSIGKDQLQVKLTEPLATGNVKAVPNSTAKFTSTRRISDDHCYTCNQPVSTSQSTSLVQTEISEPFISDQFLPITSNKLVPLQESTILHEETVTSFKNQEDFSISSSLAKVREIDKESKAESPPTSDIFSPVIISTEPLATRSICSAVQKPKPESSENTMEECYSSKPGKTKIKFIRPGHVCLMKELSRSTGNQNVQSNCHVEITDEEKYQTKVKNNTCDEVIDEEVKKEKNTVDLLFVKPTKRKCSENVAELFKTCMGLDGKPKQAAFGKQEDREMYVSTCQRREEKTYLENQVSDESGEDQIPFGKLVSCSSVQKNIPQTKNIAILDHQVFIEMDDGQERTDNDGKRAFKDSSESSVKGPEEHSFTQQENTKTTTEKRKTRGSSYLEEFPPTKWRRSSCDNPR